MDSEQDFHKVDFFFCDGPTDPWLSELLSRPLPVTHASWISKAVSEQFLMPVARYVLDDCFDCSKIEPMDPFPTSPSSSLSHRYRMQDRISQHPDSMSVPPLPSRLPTSSLSKPRGILKRPLDRENESDHEMDHRPLKKARIQADISDDSKSRTRIAAPNHVDSQATVSSAPQETHIDPGSGPILGFVSVPAASSAFSHPIKVEDVPRHTKEHFKRSVSPVLLPDNSNPNNDPSTAPCSENLHVLFWQKIRNSSSYISKATASPVRLSIADLLQAPPTSATMFAADQVYLDKRFRCLTTGRKY